MKLRPLQDRILVQRVEEETTTKGGIIIPDTAKEKPAEGKVIAVGNGRLNDKGERVPVELKVVAIFKAICPALPMPLVISFPFFTCTC